MQSNIIPTNRKPVRLWLFICLCMVVGMVIVGGLTRLTNSGLSMVDWHPISGILPPINTTQWEAEFANYQQSPQYQHINHNMALDEFQGIFWLEYIHRLFGRVTGLVFFLPFLYFLTRQQLPRSLSWRMSGIFTLGGLQGLMGWYMVQSGLIDVPWVSPLRLMAHLTLAFVIFSLLWWHILRLSTPAHPPPSLTRHKPLFILLILTFAQIMLGALVAGLDAGLLYDTFPTMNGTWVPSGLWSLDPWWKNIYAHADTVHFIHRAGALLTSIAAIACTGWIVISYRRHNKAMLVATTSLIASLFAQVTLGALTVITHVDIIYATLHQAMALLLLASVLSVIYFCDRQQTLEADL